LKTQKVYKQWMDDRNKVLEKIFRFYRLQINDEIRYVFGKIVQSYSGEYPRAALPHVISNACSYIDHLNKTMKQDVFDVSFAASLEVGSYLTNKRPKVGIDPDKSRGSATMLSGGTPYQRLVFYFNQIILKIESLENRLILSSEKPSKDQILRLIPKPVKLKDYRIPLRKTVVREAKGPKKIAEDDLSVTFISDEKWDQILDKYKSDYLSSARGPDDVFMTGPKDKDFVYAWEFERDLTDEFVTQVRDGQVEALKDAGIKQFIWVAVLDNRTCEECCVWRDGLTLDEIERLLKTKRKKDKCQGLTPPAHPNCRCDLVPAFDNLPDKPESNLKDFNTWLES